MKTKMLPAIAHKEVSRNEKKRYRKVSWERDEPSPVYGEQIEMSMGEW